MNIKQIKKLIEIVKQHGLAELKVKEGEESIHIIVNRESSTPAITLGQGQSLTASLTEANLNNTALAGSVVAETAKVDPNNSNQPSASASPVLTQEQGANTSFNPADLVTSPMVGTVYLSPNPGSDPFVQVGSTVKTGDTLCLVEAMKMFNRIEAHKDGVVTQILVNDNQSIEYGQPLFVIE